MVYLQIEKPTVMYNRISYDDFYFEIWTDESVKDIVSEEYQSRNIDYVQQYTFEMWDIYNKSNITFSLIKKIFIVHFSNLFKFKPELSDNNRNFNKL